MRAATPTAGHTRLTASASIAVNACAYARTVSWMSAVSSTAGGCPSDLPAGGIGLGATGGTGEVAGGGEGSITGAPLFASGFVAGDFSGVLVVGPAGGG